MKRVKLSLMFMLLFAGVVSAQTPAQLASRQAAEAAQANAEDSHDLMHVAQSAAITMEQSAEMQEPMCTDTTELGLGDADLASGNTNQGIADGHHTDGGDYLDLGNLYFALAETQWDAGNYAAAAANFDTAEDWFDLADTKFAIAETWYDLAESNFSDAFDHYFAGTP